MVRSTFAVVAAAVAAPANGEDLFTDIWDDSAWTTTSRRADITLPSPITPLGAATAADPLTQVNHPTH